MQYLHLHRDNIKIKFILLKCHILTKEKIHVSTNTINWDQYPSFIDTRHYIYNKMKSVPSLYRLTRHYIYIKMRSIPSLYRLMRHYIYHQMRSVPSLCRLTRHYIHNKMRSVPILYRLTKHCIYNKMRSVPSHYRHETLNFYKGCVLISFCCKYSVS
jgi:hypothetical protein